MKTRPLRLLAAALAIVPNDSAIAACSLTKLAGDYVVSTVDETNDRTQVCYGAGLLKFAASGTSATLVGRSSCSDEDPSTRTADFSIPASVTAFDKTNCAATIRYQDNNDGRYTQYRIYFDKTGTKFQGVAFEYTVGVGQIRGERQ